MLFTPVRTLYMYVTFRMKTNVMYGIMYADISGHNITSMMYYRMRRPDSNANGSSWYMAIRNFVICLEPRQCVILTPFSFCATVCGCLVWPTLPSKEHHDKWIMTSSYSLFFICSFPHLHWYFSLANYPCTAFSIGVVLDVSRRTHFFGLRVFYRYWWILCTNGL